MTVEIYLTGGQAHKPDYIIPIPEDESKEGWDDVWAMSRIDAIGKSNMIEVHDDLFIPLHRVSFIRINRSK